MTAESSLRSQLLLLQNKTKRDPESYREEFLAQLEHFNAQCKTLATSITGAGTSSDKSTKNGGRDRSLITAQFIAVANYISSVAHCYPTRCADLPDQLIALLRSAKTQLASEARLAIVKDLVLLRGRDLVPAEKTFPVFFELLLLRDKTLRHLIIHHIIGDAKRLNLGTSKNTVVNRKLQSNLFAVADDDDAVQARCALLILMDLYNRNIWADERTVEVIAKGCFSKHSRIIQASLRFFLMQLPKLFTSGSGGTDSEDSDGNDPGRQISKLKQKLKIKKKTVKRERVLDRAVSKQRRRYDAAAKEEERLAKLSIDPLRFIRDPQGFAERLFAKLQRTTERFEIRILYLNVLARVIAEHEVVVLPLYNWLERFMEPTQAKVTQILALTAASVHKLIPPDPLLPLVRTIANHFVSDRSNSDSITIGINTIREICKRQPMAMTPELLADLVEYKQQRGDRGVIMAARALLQLYREVQPQMLPAKLRGSKSGAAEVTEPLKFGAPSPLKDIPGIELLIMEREGQVPNIEADDDNARALLDGLSSGSDSESSGESSGSESGSWQSVSSGSSGVVDLDAPPKLVPIKPALTGGARAVAAAAHPPVALTAETLQSHSTVAAVDVRKTRKPLDVRRSPPKAQAPLDDDDLWVDSEQDDDGDDEDRSVGAAQSQQDSRRAQPQPRAPRARHAEPVRSAKRRREPSPSSSESSSVIDIGSDDSGEWVEGEWTGAAGQAGVEEEGAEEEELEEEEEEQDEEADEEANEEADDEDEEVEEELEAEESAPNVEHQQPAEADGFYEEVGSRAPSSRNAALSVGEGTTGSRFSTTTHLLTDEDFARLAQLRARVSTDKRLMKQKNKELAAREKRRDALLHDTSMSLTSKAIETFTEKKRQEDKEDKLERTQALREASNPFAISRKRKSKLNATHQEHCKRGKLFQMTKRSARVGAKMKRSISERGRHKKELKKKDVKFRIRRGWKA